MFSLLKYIAMGSTVAITSDLLYHEFTKFEKDIIVKDKRESNKCYIGRQYLLTDENGLTYKTYPNIWYNMMNEKPYINILNKKGLWYDNIKVGDKVKVKGYGLHYPKYHLYPTIENIE